jgi:hypothetical protein
MNIPIAPEVLDTAIEAESFTGVMTINVGDARTLEGGAAFSNHALGANAISRNAIKDAPSRR